MFWSVSCKGRVFGLVLRDPSMSRGRYGPFIGPNGVIATYVILNVEEDKPDPSLKTISLTR